jgi:hypothetical protein
MQSGVNSCRTYAVSLNTRLIETVLYEGVRVRSEAARQRHLTRALYLLSMLRVPLANASIAQSNKVSFTARFIPAFAFQRGFRFSFAKLCVPTRFSTTRAAHFLTAREHLFRSMLTVASIQQCDCSIRILRSQRARAVALHQPRHIKATTADGPVIQNTISEARCTTPVLHPLDNLHGPCA